MLVTAIRDKVVAAGLTLAETWETEISTWGQEVALFRDYAEGNHRAKLTREMRDMLRINETRLDQFNINYCDLVVARMGDRLTVTSIEGDNETASKWSAGVLAYNRIDGLQMDVHDAAIRDGVTFVMVAYDNDDQQPMLAHELAWDGDTGLIPIYDRMGRRMVAAAKVWYETTTARRVNIYYADRVERFSEDGQSSSGALLPVDDEAIQWMDNAGGGVGVPVVPFVNRAKARMSYGISELASVVPLQDGLNRTLVSMVMTSELSAFQIKVADGFTPPANVTPGMWVNIPEHEGLTAKAYVLEQAALVPFIQQAQFLIDQIGTVSQTPLPGQMGGDSASGEALKQRESGLLGKVRRFQVKGGNAWEDVMALAARVQGAFGRSGAPTVKRWTCRWADAEMRNDKEVVENVGKVQALIGDEQSLREIAPVFKWDETQIQKILTQKRSQMANALAALPVPGFSDFGTGI